MKTIKIPSEKRQEVLVILLKNGDFRSLDKNTFVIEQNEDQTIEKMESEGIAVEVINY